MDDKQPKLEAYRGVFDYPCVRSKNLLDGTAPDTSAHVLKFLGLTSTAHPKYRGVPGGRVLDQRNDWIQHWLQAREKPHQAKSKTSIEPPSKPIWALDQFDFGAPGHACSICQSEARHKHAYQFGKNGRKEFDIDEENLKPVPQCTSKILPDWAHFSGHWEWIVDWYGWDDSAHYKAVAAPFTTRHVAIRLYLDGAITRSELEQKLAQEQSRWDEPRTVALRNIRNTHALGGDLLGWAHGQRRNLAYNEMMGTERGRYKNMPIYSEYNQSGESDGSDDMGVSAPISAHKTHKHWGGDEDSPEDRTTGWSPLVATPSSAEFKYRDSIAAIQRTLILEPGAAAYGFAFDRILVRVPAEMYDRIQEAQKSINITRDWPDYCTPLHTLKLPNNIGPFDLWDETASLWHNDFTIPYLFLPAYDPLKCGFVYTDQPVVQNTWLFKPDPRDVEPVVVDVFDSETREANAEPVADEREFLKYKGEIFVRGARERQVFIPGAAFAQIDDLLKHKYEVKGKFKPWRGRTTWWRAVPAYPISGPDPAWRHSFMFYPTYGYGRFARPRYPLWRNPEVSVAGEQLIWEQVWKLCERDGLIYKDKWNEPYCVTCGHYLVRFDDWAHAAPAHQVIWKKKTQSYGRSIKNPDSACKYPFIYVTGISNLDKWESEQQTARERMEENVKAVEQIHLLANSKYDPQILDKVMRGIITEPDGAAQLGVSVDALRSTISRIRTGKIGVNDSDELWKRLLEGKEPGIYAVANFENRPEREYKIADLDDDVETVIKKFHERVLNMVTERAYKNRLESINGNAAMWREKAISRGFKSPSTDELIRRNQYGIFAYALTRRIWRRWPDLTPCTDQLQTVRLFLIRYYQQVGM